MPINIGNNKRESWWITNNTNNTIIIGDLPNTPAIKSNKRIDLLSHTSKEKISKSKELPNLLKLNILSLNKQKNFTDNIVPGNVSTADADKSLTPAEENETGAILYHTSQNNRLVKTNHPSDALQETGLVVDDDDNLVMPKSSENGIKVDITNPTFGFADIIGDQFSKNTGATKPVLTTYNGAINAWQFGAGDEAYISYHIPHDYVSGSNIFLHIHWSHIGTLVTGGSITFKATSIYAKGHGQAAFSSPAVGTFIANASTTQYMQILSETQYSASTPSGLQVDTDLLEPDGVIELTFEVDANNITVSGGGVPDPFIHFVDIHYQTTNLIGTKSRTPDFYE